ncbi:MAG: methyltransferase domain-containing protein [Chloroflexi bacterium]|nr:methyltransferase domain-containing protein [Chloroflexota bacterium]
MTQQAKRVTLFDAWAARYDTAVAAGGQDFPFAGYDEVLATAVRAAGARPSLRVLELGIGTGNLAERFVAAGCQVWGLDFSAAMLAQARVRLPQVHLVQADLLAARPARWLTVSSPPMSCMSLTCTTKSDYYSERPTISWRRAAF